MDCNLGLDIQIINNNRSFCCLMMVCHSIYVYVLQYNNSIKIYDMDHHMVDHENHNDDQFSTWFISLLLRQNILILSIWQIIVPHHVPWVISKIQNFDQVCIFFFAGCLIFKMLLTGNVLFMEHLKARGLYHFRTS